MVIPADVSTWTREHYPRDAKCYCGHTAYWHMWPEKWKIGVCDDADYTMDGEPCGCTGFAWPQPTQADVITPESPWICGQCGVGGAGPDALYIHLRHSNIAPRDHVDSDLIVFPSQEERP